MVFKDVYDRLYPKLTELENERLGVRNRMFIIIAGAIVSSIVLVSLFRSPIVLFFMFIIVVFMLDHTYKGFRNSYKEHIVSTILSEIDKTYMYLYDAHITKDDVWKSMLFKHGNRFSGEDKTMGVYNKTRFEFSEISIKHKTGSGKNSHTQHIFNGIYYIFDFNKNFSSRTQVRTMGTPYNILFDDIKYDKVELEDVDFERDFNVYTENGHDAFYILTPNLMERIKRLRTVFGSQNLYMSFLNNELHVAFSTTKDIFEPKVFQSIVDPKQIMDHVKSFELVHEIIDELNLNTRIWTKD